MILKNRYVNHKPRQHKGLLSPAPKDAMEDSGTSPLQLALEKRRMNMDAKIKSKAAIESGAR